MTTYNRYIADYVNQGIKEKENRIKVWQVQQKLVPPPPDLVKPHRVFVREGSLLKVCRRSNKSKTFFLFNDVIVYGEKLIGRSLVGYSRTIHLKRVVDMPQKEGNGIAIYGSPKSFIVGIFTFFFILLPYIPSDLFFEHRFLRKTTRRRFHG